MSNKAKRILNNVLLVIFITIFLISGFLLLRYYLNSRKQQGKFDSLSDIVAQAATEEPPEIPEGTGPIALQGPEIELVPAANSETGEIEMVLPEYKALYEMNSDLVGWMHLEDTKIDYPVMQTPTVNEYYLHKNFEKEYSVHGCYFVSGFCDVFAPSDNVTVYGHNMRDGSMMAPLHKYEKKEFFDTHQEITFNTLKERHKYQVFAIFKTSANEAQGFAYQRFIDAADQADFDQFVQTCKDLSLYDTGITPQYGDKLITLSTCDYTVSNGRLVVVASRIPKGEEVPDPTEAVIPTDSKES